MHLLQPRETLFSPLTKKDLLTVWSNFLRRSASRNSEMERSLFVFFFNLMFIFSLCVCPSRSPSSSCSRPRTVSRPSSMETRRLWPTRHSSTPCKATLRYRRHFRRPRPPRFVRVLSFSNSLFFFSPPLAFLLLSPRRRAASRRQSVKMVAEAFHCVDYES